MDLNSLNGDNVREVPLELVCSSGVVNRMEVLSPAEPVTSSACTRAMYVVAVIKPPIFNSRASCITRHVTVIRRKFMNQFCYRTMHRRFTARYKSKENNYVKLSNKNIIIIITR